jgi:hypothetical protein
MLTSVTAPPSSFHPHKPMHTHLHSQLLVSTLHILIMTIIFKYYVIFKMFFMLCHMSFCRHIYLHTVLLVHILITFQTPVSTWTYFRYVYTNVHRGTCMLVSTPSDVLTCTHPILSVMFSYKSTFPHACSPSLTHSCTPIFHTSVHAAV